MCIAGIGDFMYKCEIQFVVTVIRGFTNNKLNFSRNKIFPEIFFFGNSDPNSHMKSHLFLAIPHLTHDIRIYEYDTILKFQTIANLQVVG